MIPVVKEKGKPKLVLAILPEHPIILEKGIRHILLLFADKTIKVLSK